MLALMPSNAYSEMGHNLLSSWFAYAVPSHYLIEAGLSSITPLNTCQTIIQNVGHPVWAIGWRIYLENTQGYVT